MTKMFTKDRLNPMRRFEKIYPANGDRDSGVSVWEVYFDRDKTASASCLQGGKFSVGGHREFASFDAANSFIRELFGWGYEEITPKRQSKLK